MADGDVPYDQVARILDGGEESRYDEADELLDRARANGDTLFRVWRFRYALYRARLAARRGRRDEAAAFAYGALWQVAEDEEGPLLPRHPDVGRVETDQETRPCRGPQLARWSPRQSVTIRPRAVKGERHDVSPGQFAALDHEKQRERHMSRQLGSDPYSTRSAISQPTTGTKRSRRRATTAPTTTPRPAVRASGLNDERRRPRGSSRARPKALGDQPVNGRQPRRHW
ncbi:MAG: hypothetical protein ACR2GG_07345, partial [Gemmatimonadaceae bacterium]